MTSSVPHQIFCRKNIFYREGLRYQVQFRAKHAEGLALLKVIAVGAARYHEKWQPDRPLPRQR